MHAEVEELDRQLIETTVGRVIFNDALPKEIPFINGLLKKRGLQDLVGYCFITLGNELDGARCSTRSRRSASSTPPRPASRSASTTWWSQPRSREIIDQARERGGRDREAAFGRRHHQGERHNKIIDIWHRRHREGLGGDVPRDARDREGDAACSTRST